ncbi:MAG: DUF1631 family protein [Rhodoferax sp.]|nr:DUF1631 family protein [Rhodoferax sp.]
MNKFLLRRLGVADDPAGLKPTLHNSLEAALAQSDSLAEDILEGLKGLLTPSKVKPHALNPVAGARQVVDDLCERSDEFKKLFSDSLRAAVYGGDTQRAVDKPLVRFDDFQFLEEEQIDANIEYALTQQEVQLAVEDVLPALNGMVCSLMGWTSVQPHLNPLKPDSFVHALRTSLTAMVRREEDRAAIMTPAAGLMGAGLRQLYREITDWLRSQGVEPVLTHAKAGGGFGGAGKAPETSVTRTMLTLDKLRRLLSGELSFDLLPSANKDFTHTVPASFIALEDMKLVEPMMKRLKERASLAAAEAQAAGPAAKPPGKRSGDKPVQHEKAQSRKLGKELGEEVVRLMLENLMQDRRLMAPVRNSLKTLEPVLIKMSQSDARFFSERQHPARQFLDKITSRSLAFTSVDEPGYGRFQKTLDNSVNVLVMGENDAAGFSRVLRKLEDGWNKDEQEQRTRAEEAARELLHVEQRNMLAQRLAQEFTEKLLGKKLPDMVMAFLRGPWAQVVAQSQLLRADGSADPDGYKNLVEDLVWSVQPRLARRNRARLVDLVPSMLVTMRQGLGLISYPPERITVFFDELITIHEQAFEGGRVSAMEASGVALDPTGTAQHLDEESATHLAREEFWMAEHEASDSGFLEAHANNAEDFPQPPELPEVEEPQDWSTENLTPGCWVDLALGGVWVRAQLTWASPHRTLFMFISGAGLAHSMSRRTMDRLHGMGLIRFVSDGRVMDNALDAVAQAALRNNVGKSPDAG